MADLVERDRVKETTTTTGTGDVTLAGAATGYRAFSSVMANNDTCVYCISTVGGAEWEVGIGTFVSATPALARTTILASSNANAVVTLSAGTKDVFITASSHRLVLPLETSDPAPPTSGNWFYSRSLAGRAVPRFVGPSGIDSAVQPSLWGNTVTMWLPGTGTTASINWGISWTVATTQAHPTIADTNFMTQMRRATFTTTTTAANTTGVRTSDVVCMRGSGAGRGGWFFAARFGILTYTSTMRVFVGLAAATTALSEDPSTVVNSILMGKLTGQTVWRITTMDATTANATYSTGRTTAAAGANEIFDFQCFCKPNDTKITARVIDISTGTVLTDNVEFTTNLPVNTVPLCIHAEAQNVAGGAGSAVAIFISKLYLETDN